MTKLFAELTVEEKCISMGYIHCCGGLRKTRSFVLSPAENFVVCELDYLYRCPVCNHAVVQITRVDKENSVSTMRYVNKAARDIYKKMKSIILYEKKYYDYSKRRGGSFYLNYNEFGVQKRCYSNLSNLKIGLSRTVL